MTTSAPLPPVRREVLVAGDPATAFRLWVKEIGRWWPLQSHSVFGADGRVEFRCDDIVEYSPDGEESIWGTVIGRDTPRRLGFTWHPGRSPDEATYVEVHFDPTADTGRSLVTLEHSGWEAYADPEESREDYDEGWPKVMGRYADMFTE